MNSIKGENICIHLHIPSPLAPNPFLPPAFPSFVVSIFCMCYPALDFCLITQFVVCNFLVHYLALNFYHILILAFVDWLGSC